MSWLVQSRQLRSQSRSVLPGSVVDAPDLGVAPGPRPTSPRRPGSRLPVATSAVRKTGDLVCITLLRSVTRSGTS